MVRVLAIARLAVRSAIRSRVVAVLAVLLLAAVIGLPLTVQGDGTLAGHVRIVLHYTLAAAGLLLALSTLWAGCAALSLEIEEKQMHLVATKPVSRTEIWFGKWLGLLALNAAFLVLSGVLAGGLLYATVRPWTLSDEDRRQLREELLVARSPVEAVSPDVAAEVDRQVREILARPDRPPHANEDDLRAALRQNILRLAYTIAPGSGARWEFALPAPPDPAMPLLFRFKLSASQIGAVDVTGAWTVYAPDGGDRFELTRESSSERPDSFTVPARFAAGKSRLAVEYRAPAGGDITVVFDPRDGLRLLNYAGPFVPNLARALGMMFCQLALLGALGLAAGALFSMPVAAFCSAAALLFVQAGGFVREMSTQAVLFVQHTHSAEAPLPTIWDDLFRAIFKVLAVVLAPLDTPDALDRLAEGLTIEWTLLGWTALVKIVIYGAGLGLIASWIFRRRELGLPSG